MDSEGVFAAGSTESSEELDSRGESDKGAFDVVTRATTNHGLHRGSFQCTAIIETTVDAATENLNTALKALAKAEASETPETPENSDTASDSDQEVVSTTALEKAIAAASELKETDYTADSWKALQDALSVAKTALDEKKDQATVDTATENLNKAISALVKSSSTETKKTSTATTEDKKTSGTGTSATSGSVQTGDPTSVFGWLALAVSSLGAGGFALKRRKRREDVE